MQLCLIYASTKLETGKILSLYNVYLPHDLLVYPPKIFFPTKVVAVSSRMIPICIILTYPMKYWCILRKYISQPLLSLQLVPCHHIVSEMYLQPSRPQMHANSASRQNSRFVPLETASFLKSSSNLCCFPQ